MCVCLCVQCTFGLRLADIAPRALYVGHNRSRGSTCIQYVYDPTVYVLYVRVQYSVCVFVHFVFSW